MADVHSLSADSLRPVLGGPHGLPVSLHWLRRGLATFVWSSTRSLASLHQRAAHALRSWQPSSPPPGHGLRFQLAGSFVQYLFERQGMQRLRRFFRRAEKLGIDRAARVAFGKGFYELEAEWEDMLRSMEQ